MQKLRILIAEDDSLVAVGLQDHLAKLGHQVVGVAGTGGEAISLVKQHQPDLAIFDIKLPGLSGLTASQKVMEQQPLPIILLTAYSEPKLIEAAEAVGVMSYLIKPVDERDLAPAITLAWRRFQELRALHEEVASLKEAVETRKLVEQAKGILMKRRHLGEQEAFQRLRQQARQRRVKLAEIARTIIEAEKMIGKDE